MKVSEKDVFQENFIQKVQVHRKIKQCVNYLVYLILQNNKCQNYVKQRL